MNKQYHELRGQTITVLDRYRAERGAMSAESIPGLRLSNVK